MSIHFPFTSLPGELQKLSCSFLPTEDQVSSRAVCAGWKKINNALISEGASATLESLKSQFLQKIGMVDRVCMPYQNIEELVNDLSFFQITANSEIETLIETEALKTLIKCQIVEKNVSIRSDSPSRTVNQFDILLVEEAIEPCRVTYTQAGDLFVKPAFLSPLNRGGYPELDNCSFWDTVPIHGLSSSAKVFSCKLV